MSKSLLRLLVVCGMLMFVTSINAQESPISHLLRVNAFTPVPDHESDLVPGMLLVVNWQEGTSEFEDPLDDAAALVLAPPLTRGLDKMTSTKVKGVSAATAGLKDIVGFDPVVSFKNENEYTFSGVNFSGIRLKTQDIMKLIKSGQTHDSALSYLTDGRNDVFLITEVDSTKSINVTSNKDFQVSGGSSTSQSDACTKTVDKPQDSAASGDTTASADKIKPAADKTKTAAGAGTDSGATNPTAGGKTQASGGATVADAKNDAAKTKDDASAGKGGTFTVCRRTDRSYTFLNDTPLPSALKVVRIVLLQSGAVKQYVGAAAVPLGDSKLLKRHFQNNDSYNPPHPSN